MLYCLQINYKIEFINIKFLKNLSYRFLYKILLNKLEIIRKYFINNLYKRFIKLSNALFVFFVLFVKKPYSRLCFYIDYYKLNKITKKNRYFLLLIKKTLLYISKTKTFIKINIKQTFYYI